MAIGLITAVIAGSARAEDPVTDQERVETLPEVTVKGQAEETGYVAKSSTAPTKTDMTLLETPQAVSIVTRQFMDDRNARKLEDVLQNVAGVTIGGYYSDWDYFRIRGFNASFDSVFMDGLHGDYGMYAETYGLDRVEIIKGPASTLYGQGPLSGLVNIVSKRPKRDPFADVQLTVGSYGFYEPALDVNGSLNDRGTVYARVTALYRDQDSFVDFANKQRTYVAPALTWDIGPNTTLTVLSNYLHDSSLMAMPLPAVGTVLPNINGDIPINRFLGEPDSGKATITRMKIGYELQHRFSETVSLRQNVSLNRLEQRWPDLYYNASFDADERTLYRYPYDYRETLDRAAVDTALEANLETGAIAHTIIGGIDYYRTRSDNGSNQIDYSDFPGSYRPIDVFDPVYGATLPTYVTSTSSLDESHFTGLYLQDQAKIERVTMTVGGRFDWSSSETSSDNDSVTGFTMRGGAAYEFTPGVAAYANYSESFEPQWFSRDASGNVVDPETGENLEAGVKTLLMNGRVDALFAVYQLTRRNVATDNPSTPDPFDSIASGEQRSRGVELEGTLRLVPGWDLKGAYAYTDAEVTKDNTIPVGTTLAGVPKHSLSAWSKYVLQHGAFKGFGVGLGGRYYSEQEGDATYSNPFELPAYGVVDAALYYERGPFNAQINVDNVFDKEYFIGAYNDLYVLPGEPLSVQATVGWTF
ncbi:MAG: TonB-dependent siderophore receptor [Nitrospirota bacterium]